MLDTEYTYNFIGSRLYVGMCTYGKSVSKNTSNFVGWFYGDVNYAYDSPTLYYATTSGSVYFESTNLRCGTKINTTFSLNTVSGSPIIRLTSKLASPRKTAFYIDINKNYNLQNWYHATLSFYGYDLNNDDFYSGLQTVTPTVRGLAYSPHNYNVGFNEAEGPLDSLNVYWNKWAVPLEIYGLGAYVWY